MTQRPPTFGAAAPKAVVALVLQRMVINVGARMVFTFLPAISRGSGLSVETLGRALFVRDMTGLAGPALGRLAARIGSWRTMIGAGITAGIGMGLLLLGPVGIFVGFLLWGLCRTAYTVGINTWLSSVVTYEYRGRASGLMELTWAASAFIGLPIMGVLIDFIGWWAAPLTLSLLGMPISVWMISNGQLAPDDQIAPTPIADRVRFGANTWFGLVSFALLTAGAQFLWFTHGLWLEDTYDFDASQVGFAIVLVGLAEGAASFGTAQLADRLGKRVGAAIGGLVLLGGLVAMALNPAPPIGLGLAMLAISFLGFEFAIVASLPLISELEPMARSRAIGLGVGLSTVGRALVSLIAGWLYLHHGFPWAAASGAAVVGVAVLVIVGLLREPEGGEAKLAVR